MKNFVKIILYFIISIGFFWSHFDFVNVIYNCHVKNDIFPEYYAALPFIYKAESLASSMAVEYYVSGILLNSVILTIIFLSLDFLIQKFLIQNKKIFSKLYLGFKVLIVAFSLFSIYISYTFLNDDHIYLKSDFRKDVKAHNADCKAEIIFFSTHSN